MEKSSKIEYANLSTDIELNLYLQHNPRSKKFLSHVVSFLDFIGLKKNVLNKFIFNPPKTPFYMLVKHKFNYKETKFVQYELYFPNETRKKGFKIDLPKNLQMKSYKLTYNLERKNFIKSSLNSIPVIKIENSKNVSKILVIYSHGNSSDIGTITNLCLILSLRLGIDLLLYDYSGYGHSNPNIKSSEKNVFQDLDAVTSFAINYLGYQIDRIIFWGFSLGSAPSIHICSRFRFGGLILQSPFASINAWIYGSFDFESLSKSSNDFFCNYRKIKNVTTDVLLFHGTKDQIVNVAHSHFLYKMYNNPTFGGEEQNIETTKLRENTCTFDSVTALEEFEIKLEGSKFEGDVASKSLGPSIIQTLLKESQKKGSFSFIEIKDGNHNDMHKKLLMGDENLINTVLNFIWKTIENAEFGVRKRVYSEDVVANAFFKETYKDVFVNVNFENKILCEYMKDSKKKGVYRSICKYLKSLEPVQKEIEKIKPTVGENEISLAQKNTHKNLHFM